MKLATRDGLNRYDGNTFVMHKHNPDDPETLSDNFIQDLIEDDQGYLWATTNNGGVRPLNFPPKFSPAPIFATRSSNALPFKTNSKPPAPAGSPATWVGRLVRSTIHPI
jgi:hypothetical protein